MPIFPFAAAGRSLDEQELEILRHAISRHTDPTRGLWSSKVTPGGTSWYCLNLAALPKRGVFAPFFTVAHFIRPNNSVVIVEAGGVYEQHLSAPSERACPLAIAETGALSSSKSRGASERLKDFLVSTIMVLMGDVDEEFGFKAAWIDKSLINLEQSDSSRSQVRIAGEPVDGKPEPARSPSEMPQAPLEILMAFTDSYSIVSAEAAACHKEDCSALLDREFVVVSSAQDVAAWHDAIKKVKGGSVAIEVDPNLKA